MFINVRDRVPSTEYTQTALDNKHRRSAAELLSLAYSGNETVTLVPATVECGTEAESFGEILCTNGKNQGKDPKCSQRQVGQRQVSSTDHRSWRSHPDSVSLTSRSSLIPLPSAPTQRSPIAHQSTQSLFLSDGKLLEVDSITYLRRRGSLSMAAVSVRSCSWRVQPHPEAKAPMYFVHSLFRLQL